MSVVDGLAGVMAQIAQIQNGPSIPALPGADGFEAVMQQVATPGAPSTGTGSTGTGNTGGASTGGGNTGGSTGGGNTGSASTGGASGVPSATLPSGTDLSGRFGWPLEEGQVLTPGQLAALGSPIIASGPPAGTSAHSSTSAVNTSASLPTTGEPVTLAGLESAPNNVNASGTPLDLGSAVVADAQKYLGIPYQWGGTNPATGLDCSGLVQNVFKDMGISLPRTSQEQAQVGTPVASVAAAQPGDLLFFPGSDGTPAAPGHVGIYIGNGQMIDAPYTGTVVRVEALSDAGTPTAIRRISGGGLPLSTPTATAAGAAPVTGDATSAGQLAATGAGMATGAAYTADFAQASATYGLPQGLLSAVAKTESSYDPQAVSSAGAEGLMQLMPATAASLGVDPFNPTQAIPGAASLLASYHQQFGSWSLALAAYNAGPNAVIEHGGIPPYPQTQAYVQNVLTNTGMES